MTNEQRLKKMHREAKKIKAKRPGLSYSECLRKAGHQISGKKPAKKKSAVAGRRASGRKAMAGIPDTPTQSQHRSALVKSFEEQLGWAMVAHSSAKTKAEKKKLSKRVADLKAKVKAAKSL